MSLLHSRRPFTGTFLVALCLGVGAAGCGPLPQDEDPHSPAHSGVAANETILAEVDVGYGKVRFHELTAPDGTKSQAMSELAPATMRKTPVEALQRQGPWTMREAFQAIAPQLPVPEAIAEAHAAQAQALGRASTEVRHAAFDKDAPVEKSVSFCESWVYQDVDEYTDWVNKLKKTNVSGDVWLNVGTTLDDWTYFATAAKVTLGLCNESDVAITGQMAYDDTEDTRGWFYGDTFTLDVGYAWRWWNASTTRYYCPGGGICLHQVPIKYGVRGVSSSGKLFHLRTATQGDQQCTSNAQCAAGWSCNSGVCFPIIG